MNASIVREKAEKYWWPETIFDQSAASRLWTCVRPHPRWEKRFARWLRANKFPCFLPVSLKETVSHRKRRTSALPLFPGYVFVQGNHGKQDFSHSGSVVRTIKPQTERTAARLARQIRDVWCSLASGSRMEYPVEGQAFQEGDPVEILSGSLKGVRGNFIRRQHRGVIVVFVDMIGTGISVELPPDCRIAPINI